MKGKSKKVKGKIVSASLRLGGVILLFTIAASAQWVKQTVDTTASLRGLSVVNEKIIWASGTGGAVIRTIDGGKTWKVMIVPGAEKLDFRDIEAFDANTAYILSIGNGESSRIYKTTDGGETWKEQFHNENEKAFFDAIACSDRERCLAVSDPVDGRFRFIKTNDGGARWETYESAPAKDGEAAFAASGTCLMVQQVTGVRIFYLVTGGTDARVFKLFTPGPDGVAWIPYTTSMLRGTAGSGIFSIAMVDRGRGVIVGGNYEKPNEAKDNLAFTIDGGTTWRLGTGLTGYRSAVAYIDKKSIIAVGTNGTDLSTNGGKTWKKIGSEDLNSVATKSMKTVWAVGPKGGVYKLK